MNSASGRRLERTRGVPRVSNYEMYAEALIPLQIRTTLETLGVLLAKIDSVPLLVCNTETLLP